MTVNRGLLVVGILLAIVGATAVFLLNLVFAPPTDYIIAARQDIPAGTRISDLGEDAFVTVPVQFTNPSARLLLEGVAQPEDLAAMRATGAVVIQDIFRYQPLTLGSVVSADNPAAARVMRLGLDDPSMMVITIPTQNNNVPEGIRAGDRVDLAVAVTSVSDILSLAEEGTSTIAALPGTTLRGVPNEALAALLMEAGYVVEPPSGEAAGPGEATPTPEPTLPGPVLREPVTTILVRGALVVNVRYQRSLAGVSQQGQATMVQGDMTGIDVVIPRDAVEFVTMALNGGNLQVGLLSPLVGGASEGPTLGASLQDLLDLFGADREELTTGEGP